MALPSCILSLVSEPIEARYKSEDVDGKYIYATARRTPNVRIWSSGSHDEYINLGTIVEYEWGRDVEVVEVVRTIPLRRALRPPVIVSITLSMFAETRVPIPPDDKLKKMYKGLNLRGLTLEASLLRQVSL